MKAKKSLAILLVVSIAFSWCIPLAVMATGTMYQLVADSVEITGTETEPITVDVYFKASCAQPLAGVQATWTLKEKENSNYLTLTALTPIDGGTTINNETTDGITYWLEMSGTGVSVDAGDTIWKATYTIDPNTPAGFYTVGYVGKTNYLDADNKKQEATFDLTATINVTKSTPKQPYEIYYTLNSTTDAETVNYKDYQIGDTVTATISMVSNNADVTLQAYDIYLTHDSKLRYSSVSMGGAEALTNAGADATETAGLTHLQLVAKEENITLSKGVATPLGTVTFTIDPTVEYGYDMPITLTQGTTNISIAQGITTAEAEATGDTQSYYPNVIQTVDGVTYSGAEVVTKYDVTFDTDGGSDVATQEVGHNLYASDPGTPTKDGYEFKGWFADANKTTVFDFTATKITKDTTIYAKWEQTTFTVKWYDACGNVLENETQSNVASGSKLTVTDAQPEKTDTAEWDYTFIGWNTESTASEKLDLTNYTVSSDLHFYPVYSSVKQVYTVTWKNEDGTVLETDTDVAYGTVPTYDGATPTKDATAGETFTFKGWSPAVVAVTGDAEYKATYTSTTNQYTVTYSVDGAETTVSADYNTSITLKTPDAKNGYTFDAWYNEKDEKVGTAGANYNVLGDIKLIAKYTANPYTITFNVNGGNDLSGDAYSEPNKMSYTIDSDKTLPAATRNGYTFDGWVVSATTFGWDANTYGSGTSVTGKWGDVTLVAKWSANPYTVSVKEGIQNGTVTLSKYSANIDDVITITATPNTGYEIDTVTYTPVGSSAITVDPDNGVYSFTMPATDVTVNVAFKEINYKVEIDSENISNGKVSADETANYGDTVMLTATPSKGYKVTGYTVTYTDANNTEQTVQVNTDGIFVMPAYDVTVTATFDYISYTIAFDANGGNGTTASIENVQYNVETELTANNFTRNGYKFVGWATSADGEKVYDDKAKVKELTDKEETVTLYAVWTEDTFVIIYNENGAAEIEDGSYTFGTGVTLATISRNGYEFEGWFDNEGLSGDAVTAIGVDEFGQKEFWAKWSLKTYNITYGNTENVTSNNNPSSFDVETNTITLQDPTKNGYSFDGWYSDKDLTEKVTTIEKGTYEDVTLYAKWNLVTYTVELNANGGTVTPETVTYNIEDGGILPTPSNGLFTFKGWKVTKAVGNWKIDDNELFTAGQFSNGYYGNETENVVMTAQWGFEVKHDVEDYKYAYNTKDATGGYVMLRVADNLDSGKEYMFGDTSMYYTEDPNYLLNDTDTNYTGVFYLLIGEEYFDSVNNALNDNGEKLLKVADAASRKMLLTEGEKACDINGDGVVNIADANIVYQMVQNGGAYYSYDDGQNDGQLDNKHRLMADLATATDDTDNEHRASIMDVNAIVNHINGVVETTNP